MIRVSIVPGLLENCLRSGYKLGKLLEVVNGLPMNAQLVRAEFEGGLLRLYFSQPTVPDSELSEINITIKSVEAKPVDLETVPTPKPKHDPIVVTRNIAG